MYGAIIGDVGGSAYEFHNVKHKDVQLFTKYNTFTDDTVCTVAVMDWLLSSKDRTSESFVPYLLKWTRRYPNAGYGGRFRQWIHSDNQKPYHSYGNGAAMRISPVAWVANSVPELIDLSNKVTGVTHDHPEGMKGAAAVACCIYMAINGKSKQEIYDYAISVYPEIKDLDYEDLRRNYSFDETCQGSIPQAIYCFLISSSYHDCITTAISIGGDSDTIADIAGSIAEAYWGIPEFWITKVRAKLNADMLTVIDKFYRTYVNTEESKKLNRFVEAQEDTYDVALKEIKEGRKKSHWVWYIFPQLKGLGMSENSEYYGIAGLKEAMLYCNHPILGPRLVEICEAVVNSDVKDVNALMGSIDAMKLKSCATLFYLATKDSVFMKILQKYFDGQMCQSTMQYAINANISK